MTSFKNVIKSISTTMRRVEREQQRSAKKATKQFEEQLKNDNMTKAEQMVKDWAGYIESITSLHTISSTPINWGEIASQPKPSEPVFSAKNEEDANSKLKEFKPSFLNKLIFDKLLSRSTKKIKALEGDIEISKKCDQEAYGRAQNIYQKELAEWEYLQGIAQGVRSKDVSQYEKAILHFNSFSELAKIGSKMGFVFNENLVEVNLYVHCIDEMIPSSILSQTASGKLSKKQMSKSTFYKLYQDHVCSATLRVALEIFNHLPVPHVKVNCLANLINPQNGFLEEAPILSVIIPEKTLKMLNLETLVPSDSMTNFLHNMNFKKTGGFKSVEIVNLKPA
ncbi:MAG: hypothetical protein ACRCTY_09040 [Candidatus Adiutrix sp.]